MVLTRVSIDLDSAQDDLRLLRRYAEHGDEDAFRRVGAAHLDFVYSVCRREGLTSEQSQDVTQEVFLALAKNSRRLRTGTVAAWLYAVAVRKSKDVRRSSKRLANLEPEDPKLDDERDLDLSAAIAALPEVDREVIVLRYLQGMTNREVADRLGSTEDAVRMRCARVLQRLRSKLGAACVIPLLPIESCPINPDRLLLSPPLPRLHVSKWAVVAALGGVVAVGGFTYVARRSSAPKLDLNSGAVAERHIKDAIGTHSRATAAFQAMHARVAIYIGDKVAFSGETWRTKDVTRWSSTIGDKPIEAEVKDGIVRSITDASSDMPGNVTNVVIAPAGRRIVETDAAEATLLQLPGYLYGKQILQTVSLDAGKLRRNVVTLDADGGRHYQVWLSSEHSEMISKIDYTVGDFHFVSVARKWLKTPVGDLPAEVEVRSWYKGVEGEKRRVRISDVQVGGSIQPPPMPAPKRGTLVMDEIRHTAYRIDSSWKRITDEIKVGDGDIGFNPDARDRPTSSA